MRRKVTAGRPQAKRGADQTQPVRKPRVDAERNRELLVSAGKAVFSESGPNASLEEIARRAKVGIGTFYRHFPTRDSIIEAVYCCEVEHLALAAKDLVQRSHPGEALHEWMRLFIDYIATKKVLASALCSTLPNASDLTASSGVRILEALTLLVTAAAASGDIRTDVDPRDLLRALADFTYAGMGPDWGPSARRLIDLLMDGLRTHANNRRVSRRSAKRLGSSTGGRNGRFSEYNSNATGPRFSALANHLHYSFDDNRDNR